MAVAQCGLATVRFKLPGHGTCLLVVYNTTLIKEQLRSKVSNEYLINIRMSVALRLRLCLTQESSCMGPAGLCGVRVVRSPVVLAGYVCTGMVMSQSERDSFQHLLRQILQSLPQP